MSTERNLNIHIVLENMIYRQKENGNENESQTKKSLFELQKSFHSDPNQIIDLFQK